MASPEKPEDIYVVDEETRARYIMAHFRNCYVVIHPKSSAIPLSPVGVQEACMGYLRDGNAGGFLLEQHHKDGTRTRSFFPMEQIAMIHELNIDQEDLTEEKTTMPEE